MRALLSVWDKSGIGDLARRLRFAGVDLISTGGTMSAIQSEGVRVTSVSDLTGFPELIDGRVKTLHPVIHGGLLARRDLPAHMTEIANHDIEPIDLVVANLYPFGDVVARPDVLEADALEHIDIGGPAMIRAAAKNFPGVVVVVDPKDYDAVATTIEDSGFAGFTHVERRRLAAKAFAHVSAYDAVVAEYLRQDEDFPDRLSIAGSRTGTLRYGENPHQRAALYRRLAPGPIVGVGAWQLLGGKEMSYNNYLDANAARLAVLEFDQPTIVIVKHANPCGVSSRVALEGAYESALSADPVSAFGGVVAANVVVDVATAERVGQHFFEVIIAPDFSPDALELLRRKKNLRLVKAPLETDADLEVRALDGGFLLQERDIVAPNPDHWKKVTRRQPSAEELRDLSFAWRAVRHVKSNAIVLASDESTVGIGGGQPNRVDAVRLAVERAGDRSRGSVLASDAFFPFPDGLDAASAAGVTAVAQPGGSVRDDEVIAAADAADIAMVFTGVRHFRH